MVTAKERFLREMALEGEPEVRSHISITYPVWKEYGERLNWLEGFSKYVSVGISRSSDRPAYSEVTDAWGCRWIYPLESLDGQCIGHPIAFWDALKDYEPPDPNRYADWDQVRQSFEKIHARAEAIKAAM